jgi:predicted enzyme related to lactoylglutathione lyase
MPPRITITLDCVDPAATARFWADALGYTAADPAGVFWPLVPPDEREPIIVVQQVPDAPKVAKNRMHLDVHVSDLDAEVARIEALGGRRVSREPMTEHHHTWHVMADPEGNEFCVVLRPIHDR